MEMTTIRNRLMRCIRERKPAFGSWIALTDTTVTEIMADADLDWVLIDCEECQFD